MPPERLHPAIKSLSHWAHEKLPQPHLVVASMLGVAGPVAVGVALGHAGPGLTAALGGLALGGKGGQATHRKEAVELALTVAAGSAALFIGCAAAGRGALTSLGVPFLIAVAALLGGASDTLARLTTTFIIFTLIALNLGDEGMRPVSAMLLFLLGALWTAAAALGFRLVFGSDEQEGGARAGTEGGPGPAAEPHRWWSALARFPAWSFALRLVLCLLVAEVYTWARPHHHGYWISTTIAIVVRRDYQAALSRKVHRLAGTVMGVLLASLLVVFVPTVWFEVAMIALLAAGRPIFRDTNYALYAATMTPLVFMLLDLGHRASGSILVDRLLATLVGCVIAFLFGYLGWRDLSAALSRRAQAPSS
jgi:hypothetical protein